MKNYSKKLSVLLCIMLLMQSGIFGGIFPFLNPKVTAATNSVKVQMYNTSTTATTNTIYPQFRIVNTGTNSVNLSDIKMRYYYTIDGDKTQSFVCDYSTIGNSNVTGTFVKMTTSQSGADYYLEIGFKTGSLAPNGSVDVQTRFYKSDWTSYTQTGDYSFNSTGTSFVDWNKVTAYFQGTLVWGSAPGGGVTPTSTNTPTKTATATPTKTSTPTKTNTPANTPTPTIPGTDTTLLTSGDAYIKYNSIANQWTIGTGKVEKKIRLNGQGQYLLTSFVNKITGKEYIQGGQISDEFSITVGGTEYTGSNSSWTFVSNSTSTLKQGEIQLTVTAQNSVVTVARNYVIYPSTGVIQEWNVFTNRGSSTVNFRNPSIIRQRIMNNDLNNTDFHYMTGGANFSGSNTLKTVQLTSSYTRHFDSYDSPEVSTVDNYTLNGFMDNKQGAAIWNEFYALRDRASSQGIFMTFDYLGHWSSDIGNMSGNIYLSPSIVTSNDLASGSSITTGKGLTGVFSGDVDDMGNTILDYVYHYKWDYTNDKYLATVSGGQNYSGSTVPPPDQMPNAFEVVRYLRYVGADNYGIDDSWQNRNGDWNNGWAGDFPGLNDYLNKNNMTLTVWYPPWQADSGSKVLSEHPEYEISGDTSNYYYKLHLNDSRSDVIDWELKLLSSKQSEWGSHIWRYDAQPIWAANSLDDGHGNAEDNTMINQSRNFYDLLQRFKDQNKNAGISGCSSGGELITIESARFSDVQQSTDGNVCHMENYWNSLITPPD
ncbi:MAG: cellulose binding domain-containing protein, partial [Bacillota bacterium]|nr:cellulose binding domain-containing protein [Bacillota bacterium]